MSSIVVLVVACGATETQPTVTIATGSGGATCDEGAAIQDPYEAALARARCDHPDMLVHPDRYVLKRVPSPLSVTRFQLDGLAIPMRSFCCYEVDHAGAVATRPIALPRDWR
jgi:hypothetical protein